MADEREQRYLTMIEQFPDSPLGFFSLGRYYLELSRFDDAAEKLTRCTDLDPKYAAALVALGDAHAAAGRVDQAKVAFARGRVAALEQGHPELAEEIDERVAEL